MRTKPPTPPPTPPISPMFVLFPGGGAEDADGEIVAEVAVSVDAKEGLTVEELAEEVTG